MLLHLVQKAAMSQIVSSFVRWMCSVLYGEHSARQYLPSIITAMCVQCGKSDPGLLVMSCYWDAITLLGPMGIPEQNSER